MDWTHLIAFNVALAAAILSPGPALLYLIRQAITGGFRTGWLTGLGLGLVAAGWTAAALLGLDLLFLAFPWAYTVIKVLGAAYLMWIAVQMWRSARAPVTDSARPVRKAFWGGVLINLANPKSVLFAASVLIVIFPVDLTLAEKALITLNHFTVEIIAYTVLSALLSTPAARAGYLRLKPAFDRAAGLVMGALGLRLLLSR